jgi:hypothetical protein
MNASLLCAALLAVAATAPAAPVEILPPELRGAVQPQLAVAPGGRVHVVFGKGDAIYHASAPDGRTFSPPVKVGELPKLALRMRRGPRVTATDRAIFVTAISHTDGDLHGWQSTDDGATWRETPRLNRSPKSAREGMHALAGDGRGLVFAAWLDIRSGGMELWGAASRDGGATWEADRRIYASPDGHICECCHPSVTVDAAGRVAVMWRNWLGGARDMYLATSTDGGATFGPAGKLGSGTWPLKGCPMDGGSIAFDAARPVTVWRREGTVFLSATPQGEEVLAGNARQPALAFGPSGASVVWEQAGGLWLRRGAGPSKLLAPQATMPAIAARPGGEPVVAWESATTTPATILLETLP